VAPSMPRVVSVNCLYHSALRKVPMTLMNISFCSHRRLTLNGLLSEANNALANRCTKIGGWIEHAELTTESSSDDNTEGENWKRLVNFFNQALENIGRPPARPERMKQQLEDVGFTDIRITTEKQPFGLWPRDKRLKHIGAMTLLMAETGVEACELCYPFPRRSWLNGRVDCMAPFTRVLGIPASEATKICEEALRDIGDGSHHSYVN
jgi:hypothetical protein